MRWSKPANSDPPVNAERINPAYVTHSRRVQHHRVACPKVTYVKVDLRTVFIQLTTRCCAQLSSYRCEVSRIPPPIGNQFNLASRWDLVLDRDIIRNLRKKSIRRLDAKCRRRESYFPEHSRPHLDPYLMANLMTCRAPRILL